MHKVNHRFLRSLSKCSIKSKSYIYIRSSQLRDNLGVAKSNSISHTLNKFLPFLYNIKCCHTTNQSLTEQFIKSKSLIYVLVNNSPEKIKPYLKLMRLHQPTGCWLLFWPCSWSLGMATENGELPDLSMLALFGAGSLIMRGAGCTINDMWDRDTDAKVFRTKDRPLVTGQITMFKALIFLGSQLSVALLILLQLNWYSICLGASSLALVVIYPLMKKITYWPQFMLGCTFNWGALMGWSAIHGSCDWSTCLPLYIAGIFWTLFYDTIYAHQDIIDDINSGVKSTAIKFGSYTKLYLASFALGMTVSLLVAGYNNHQTIAYYCSVGAVSAHLGYQLKTLDINQPLNCWKQFISNKYLGLILFMGITAGTYLKKKKNINNT